MGWFGLELRLRPASRRARLICGSLLPVLLVTAAGSAALAQAVATGHQDRLQIALPPAPAPAHATMAARPTAGSVRAIVRSLDLRALAASAFADWDGGDR